MWRRWGCLLKMSCGKSNDIRWGATVVLETAFIPQRAVVRHFPAARMGLCIRILKMEGWNTVVWGAAPSRRMTTRLCHPRGQGGACENPRGWMRGGSAQMTRRTPFEYHNRATQATCYVHDPGATYVNCARGRSTLNGQAHW